MRLIDREYVRSLMPRRDPAGHKGTFGKVYLLGGSVGYTGAPVLCAAAAERSGCGLVLLGVPESVWPSAAVKCCRSRTDGCRPPPRRRYAAAPPAAMPWLWAAAWGGERRATCCSAVS